MMRPTVATLAAIASLATGPAAYADAANEAGTARLFDRFVESPTALRIFLRQMPKGGDLHNHLSGSPYAEDYLHWASAAGYCADKTGTALTPPPCAEGRSAQALGERDPFAYARLIDGMSTRGLQKGIARNDVSGHTQFFASFDRFGAVSSISTANAMAATRRLAAGDRVDYIELIHNPRALTEHVLAGADTPLTEADLAAAYAREITAIDPVLTRAKTELDRDEADVRAALGCAGRTPDAACGVAIHYLAWGWRDLPPAQVFRSLILAFALADRDPRYVGVNIVQPEDWVVALRDYDLHMAMFRFLAAKYPRIRRTLHAGELAFGAVPPQDLRDHIAKALDAGAQRIGHGTAIAYEADALATMARMAKMGVAVEINLTSNDVILDVMGGDHPLRLYRKLGVPVVLSTDDEGILRTDLTNEYVRAAREQGLGYADLKQVARASLQYAFLPGESLWADGHIGTTVDACAQGFDGAACRRLQTMSEKAAAQARLERELDQFETMALATMGGLAGQAKSRGGRDQP